MEAGQKKLKVERRKGITRKGRLGKMIEIEERKRNSKKSKAWQKE